jgi:phosphomannomutase
MKTGRFRFASALRKPQRFADSGITIDGDADRVMFINEKGEIIPATYITALIAGEILRETKNARILVDIRYTRNVQNIVSKMGGEVGYTKVGHALITEQVNTEKAEFAGESSGHYYFKEMGGCESSVRVILYVLRVLAREKKPISEILSEMRTSIESGEFNYELAEGTDVKKLLSTIVNDYKDGELNELDGIAISYPEWRFSIRTSNTEPLLRLNIEGQTEEIVHEKVKELSDKILATGAQLLE